MRLVWRSRVRVKEYCSKMVDEAIPQKIRDGVNPGLIPSHPSLTPNQTLPKRINLGFSDERKTTIISSSLDNK
jgi:hypothetical protein